MDNFQELEDKLRSLIEEHSVLRRRNTELETAARENASKMEEANDRINELVEDREKIRAKVDSLLTLLQGLSTVSTQEVV